MSHDEDDSGAAETDLSEDNCTSGISKCISGVIQ